MMRPAVELVKICPWLGEMTVCISFTNTVIEVS